MSGRYFFSSIGKKQLMGITGLALCGFVLSHMLGNLLYLVGPDAFNKYGHSITGNKAFYYPIEMGLLFCFLAHIFFAFLVVRDNRRARPVGYAKNPAARGKGAASLASRSMALSGVLILVFVVLHLNTFRFGQHYPYDLHGTEVRDLHLLMTEVFSSVGYVVWYAISMWVLAMHLSHALWSSLQTLGWVPGDKEKTILCLSKIFGWTVAIGFVLNPLYIFFTRG